MHTAITASLTVVLALAWAAPDVSAAGPLRPHPQNPCWLTDGDGKAIFLAGSHTWATIQERGVEGETPDFDYSGYLDFMQRQGHNFLRLWTWEHAAWMQFAPRETKVRYKPLPYPRTGPGRALDGGPRFDVQRFNQEYFDRLRARVVEAGNRGLYVSVMFFQGFSTEQKQTKVVDPKIGNAWEGHPFHPDNNINGINGDLDGDGRGREVHSLDSPEIVRLHEAYARKVIDTLRGLNHVIWEICNECHPSSVEWQYHMIRFIKKHDGGAKARLVGMTGSPIQNAPMFASPADWISPVGSDYLNNPPVTPNRLVIVDTDHIAPEGVNPIWVWKNFLRGNHFITMDFYRDFRVGSPSEPLPKWNAIRRAMGDAARYSARVNLARMAPRGDLASTGYCLADPGREYLALQPEAGALEVTLPDEKGSYAVEWVDVATGRQLSGAARVESGKTRFVPPVEGPAVLHLRAQ
jgi:hypothetical protein